MSVAAISVAHVSRHSEAQIVTALAGSLALLEPGLELVETQYRMVNPRGAGGRCDILARDRHRDYVLIEVKENDPTARTALQEVTKYAGLLCDGEWRIPRKKLRIMIVSTTWHELLVPVSEFARQCEYDVRGYQIAFDEDGVMLPATQVRLLTASQAQRPTPLAMIYFYPKADDRDKGWAEIIRVVAQAGAIDMIGVDFDFSATAGRQVPAPYALYVGFGTIESANYEEASSPTDEEPEDQWEAVYPHEYRALCRMTRTVFAPRPGGSCETGGPETFLKLETDPRWEFRQVRGTGTYEPGGLWRERDIRIALAGGDGEPGRAYIGLARTKVRGRWATLRVAASQALASNKEWRIILDDVLNEFADAEQEMDVFLHINNPGNLIQTLVFGMPDKIADYEPIICCTATRPDGWMFTLNGRLTWNGKPAENLLRPLRQACGVVPQSWMINSNDWWLLGSLGLHYTAQLAVVPPAADAEPVPGPIFITIDDTVRTVHEPEDLAAAGWRDYLSLGTFVARYRHQIQLFVNEQRRRIDMPLPCMQRCALLMARTAMRPRGPLPGGSHGTPTTDRCRPIVARYWTLFVRKVRHVDTGRAAQSAVSRLPQRWLPGTSKSESSCGPSEPIPW